MTGDRHITRRRFLQVSAGVGFSVLHLANGNRIVAQSATPDAFGELKEAPKLAEMVAAGTIPSVSERVPVNPLVVQPEVAVGKYGGTLRTALLGGSNTGMIERICGYEHLLRWDPDWQEVLPNVAHAYEANAESTVFTFHLREGMKWSDGQPFGADDIVFYATDIATHETLGSASNTFTAEKIDDLTVTITFATSRGLFPKETAARIGTEFTRYPKHYLSQFHATYNTTNLDQLIAENEADDWVHLFQMKGAGIPGTSFDARWGNPELPRLHAWQIVEPYAESTRVTLTRNPYYWKVDPDGNQLPYIDDVNFEVLQDEEVLLLKTTAGEIDMIQRSICTIRNKPVLAEGRESGGYNFFDAVPSIMNTNIVHLNLTHKNEVIREIFNNKDFRIGLSHAINRQEIIDTVYVSQGEPWQAAPMPGTPYYNENLAKQYTEYNVDLANEFLDKVLPEKDGDGWRLRPDGEKLSFVFEVAIGGEFPEMPDVATLVVNNWRAVGVDVQVRPQDGSLMNTRINANDHDCASWPGGSGQGDAILNPYNYMPYNYSYFAKAWYYWWRKPANAGAEAMDPPEPIQQQFSLYDQLTQTADQDEQTRLMNEILAIAEENFWVMGIGTPAVVYGCRKNNLLNIPDSMPEAAEYPTPGPTNPCQYYFE